MMSSGVTCNAFDAAEANGMDPMPVRSCSHCFYNGWSVNAAQSAIESAEFCVDFAQGCNLLTINVVAPVERVAGLPRSSSSDAVYLMLTTIDLDSATWRAWLGG